MRIIIEDETDLSALNGLAPDEKVLLVQAHTLIETTKERMKRRGNEISLPYRLQLKSDFGEIERLMQKFRVGKNNEKYKKKLEFLLVKLQTEIEHILG